MGRGIVCYCEKCKEEHIVEFGVTFDYAFIQIEQKKKIRSGEYGKSYKRIYEDNDGSVIAADYYLYRCPECGYWESLPSADLYMPKKPGRELMIIDDKCTLIKECAHKCPKCQHKMKKY